MNIVAFKTIDPVRDWSVSEVVATDGGGGAEKRSVC